MPSKYRRPAHVNKAIERTFSQDLELERGWRIDFNQAKNWFVFTCKLGMQMDKVIPQSMEPGLAAILKGIMHDHDYTKGHSKGE